MNEKCLFQVLMFTLGIALMLSLGTAGNEDPLAKKYSKNQVTTQASSCGDTEDRQDNTVSGVDEVSAGASCQNINSQIQGDDNSVALAGVH